MKIQAPKGTRSAPSRELPVAVYRREAARDCGKIQYPGSAYADFEHTELFLRGVGDTTDIVQKEMYTLRIAAEDPSRCARKERRGPCAHPLLSMACAMARSPQRCAIFPHR